MSVGDNQSQILLSVEAEAYIDALEKFDITNIGSEKWCRQHEHVEKLNMQAIISAAAQENEFIKEYFISSDKVPTLIHQLITTETWKNRIFPAMQEMKFEPKTTFSIYMVLYHEATLANLLETILYHSDACEAAEDTILDLTDYCYRKLLYFISRCEDDEEGDENEEKVSDIRSKTNMEELEIQAKKLQFDIAIKAVSILRYITDHLSCLPLSTMTRILNTHDVPVLLVELMENPPWTRQNNGKLLKFVEGKWETIPFQDSFKLTKVEGQVWLTFYQLLMMDDCQKKYELNSARKNTILKLRSHLTEVMLDQLPVLVELQRYLEQLSMMEPPVAQKNFVLEQVPEIQETILRMYEGKWKSIAKKQCKTYFNQSKSKMQEQAKRWADTYNLDMLESLITEPPKCATCGEQATKRCSRCQNEWYCRRECQVQHWSKHKKACNLLVDAMKKIEISEQTPVTS
ncbi:zinc finger MYND domain-containing protein 10-like [Tubulanus polymorphus]|uniref:zinc finger MYND domain-containing protein 10-like n=1 Tax=Tubulanus polymorphus TaxID=672921 RepID=UPI003DA32DCB